MLDSKKAALSRWKIGHHLFFIILQGLVLVLRSIHDGLKNEESQEVIHRLERATSLLWASAVCLRFAGDFESSEYEEIVRPTMEPPLVPEGFSGLLSSDHARMVKELRHIKPLLIDPPEYLKLSRDRFLKALDAVYDSHKYVCSKFDGDTAPSLRMNQASTKSAVEVLDSFHQQRRRLVREDVRDLPRCPFAINS